MEEKTLTIGFLTKLCTATLNLTAINEPDGENSYGSTKKRFQRLGKIDTTQLTKKDIVKIENYCSQINRWIEWAKKENIIETWQQNAIASFFDILGEASIYNMPLNKNMTMHLVSYAISNVLYDHLQDFDEIYPEEKLSEKGSRFTKTLDCFNFFNDAEEGQELYLKDIRPIPYVIENFKFLVNDMSKVFEFWQKKLPLEKDMDISLRFNDWKKGVVPDWKSIKIFYDSNMCPPSKYYNNELGTECYRWFKCNLYFSFCLTQFFNFLKSEEILDDNNIAEIRNGVRLYYRDVFVIRNKDSKFYSEKFEKEAKSNLMFITLFCVLEGDMKKEDTMTYLSHVYKNPEYPLLFDTKIEEIKYFLKQVLWS